MNQQSPFTKPRLFCPGPTPIPPEVQKESLGPQYYHRTSEFKKLLCFTNSKMKKVFGTKGESLLLSSSGTGAMEAAVVNFTNQGDAVLAVNGGKFGERWVKLCQTYQCKTTELKIPWGEPVSSDQIQTALSENPDLQTVFLQANETSTGTVNPIKQICQSIRANFQGLIIVDAISSLVAHPMEMDAWGIDVVVAGSQKGFGVAPGLAMIALSHRAQQRISKRQKFYFDLDREIKGQADGTTAWTPAVQLVQSLNQALDVIFEYDLEKFHLKHKRHANAVQQAAIGWRMVLFSSSPSHALTAIQLPEGVSGSALLAELRSQGQIFAGGQDSMKGKLLRFSHLGFVDDLEIISGLAAIELALHKIDYKIPLGSGVSLAMQSLANLGES